MKRGVALSRRSSGLYVPAGSGSVTPPPGPAGPNAYNAQGVWVGDQMPGGPPPGYQTVFADDFTGPRTGLNRPEYANYLGTYNNSFSGANPDSSWWDGSLVEVVDGVLRHSQIVRTRAHKDGKVDRRIESGTSTLWGMPPTAFPQVTMLARTYGPFALEGIVGTVLMLWPYGDNWPAGTEIDYLEESALGRGRSNFHWGADWPNHQQTGFREWAIPNTGTRTAYNLFAARILPSGHPSSPFLTEVWCNGVRVTTWLPPVDFRQTWPMLGINQTEGYIADNANPTWLGPTGTQVMDSLEPHGKQPFFDIKWMRVDKPAA
ncbi:hypothetical protein [Nakamurella leprariae]|uniref:GH16 domain-containing protein n=1 Tax=Nakamurella leprariae TaxID=2803911 RepID=A0A938YCF3_9ACTN|nr:hypothetical protein [Nakamurella leprariae]MBM9467269.1 hypothetical protein [Nakamurella leprariae]